MDNQYGPPEPSAFDKFFASIIGDSRLPPELLNRAYNLGSAAFQAGDDREAGLEEVYKYGRDVRTSADQKKAKFNQMVDAPLPIDAGLLALNKAVGSFSQALSPHGDFIHRADQRREFEIGQLKERRLEALKMQEADVFNEAKRAGELGDFEARTRAVAKAEKFTSTRNAIMQGMESYWKMKDDQDRELMKEAHDLDKIAFEYIVKARTGYGAKLDPKVAAQLKGFDTEFQGKLKANDIQLQNTKDIFDKDEKAKTIRQLMADREQIIQEHMVGYSQLLNPSNKPVEPPAAPAKGDLAKITKDIVLHHIQTGYSKPSEIINEIDKDLGDPTSPMWKELGLDPNDPTALKSAQNMLYTWARKIGPQQEKDLRDLRQLHMDINDYRFNMTDPRVKPLIERYNKIQARLRERGTMQYNQQPGMFAPDVNVVQ